VATSPKGTSLVSLNQSYSPIPIHESDESRTVWQVTNPDKEHDLSGKTIIVWERPSLSTKRAGSAKLHPRVLEEISLYSELSERLVLEGRDCESAIFVVGNRVHSNSFGQNKEKYYCSLNIKGIKCAALVFKRRGGHES
jgi:hypothetical protein